MPPSAKRLPLLDIRDQRLKGGRMSISLRTTNAIEWRRRESAVRALLKAGDIGLLERLRTRKDPLHIADVARAVSDRDIDRLRNIGQDAAPLTLQANVDRLLEIVKATKAEATLHQYEVVTKQLIARFEGETLITEISSDRLRAWIHEPKATAGNRPWSGARQLLAKAVVGRLFKIAIEVEAEAAERTQSRARITINPTKAVATGEVNRRAEFLRPAEWRRLSKKIEGRPVHLLLALGVLAGLRAGEAANLRRDLDIEELDGAHPRIRVQARDGEWKWKPKNKRRGPRVIPIGAELKAIIQRHIASGFAGSVYLLKNANGADRPLPRQTVQVWTAEAFTLAGIRYGRDKDALTFHSLRHSFISWAMQRDQSLKKLEMLAGTSVKMLLDVYGHLQDDDLETVIDVIDGVAKG